MKTFRSALTVATAAWVVVASLSAWGQEFRGPPGGSVPGGGFPGGGGPPGGGIPGGGFQGAPGGGDFRRGGGDRGGSDRSRGGFGDPREMLSRADANANGMIDPAEMNERGGFMRRMVERAGLDPNQPVAIDKLAASFEQMRQGGDDRNRDDRNRDDRNRDERNRDDRNRDERNRDDRNRDERNRDERNNSSNNTSTSAAAKPPAPTGPQGFGVAATATASVPGFDTPLMAGVSTEPIEKRFDAEVIEYVKENMLGERDVNKNSMLERNEWTGRWSTPPEESDLNKDGILSMEELCIRIAKRFGRDSQSRGSSPSGNSFTSASPSPPGGDSGRMRGYAESLMRQYDESRNNMLEREEWEKMRSEHKTADANRDGIITVEELAAHLQKYSSGGFGGGPAGGSSSGSRGGPSDKTPLAKRSYRVSSPIERLPKGMPDWFLRNDLDSDGQISMVEYATSWNDQIAAEFTKLDGNGDGIITPSETQGGR